MFSEEIIHTKYRPDIDGLRAIAVLSVIFFHLFPNKIEGGFIGVDIFFVISGFLISGIIFNDLENNSFSFKEFYVKRIRRIYPALIIILLFCFIVGFFNLQPSEFNQLGKYILGATTYTNNFISWQESGYFDNANITKPLLHLWSLSIEEQFYIAWPFLLWLIYKNGLNIFFATFLLTITSFSLHLYVLHINKVASFYAPQLRIWELSMGAMAFYLCANKKINKSCMKIFKFFAIRTALINLSDGKKLALKNTQSALGITLIILGLILITKDRYFPGWWAMLSPVLGTVLIISSSSQCWINKKILSNRVLIWFGMISYPLYLWHWPLISFNYIIGNQNPSFISKVIILLSSIALASITYYLIEKPIRFNIKKRNVIYALIAIMIIIGLLGSITIKSKGMPFRFKKENIFIDKILSITDVYNFFNYKKLVRTGICHSVSIISARHNECFKNSKNNIFIWGDSYAASLYNGLQYYRDKKHKNYGISQLTDANGPPFFTNSYTENEGGDIKTLIEANNNRLNIVGELKPSAILIAWMIHGGSAIHKKEGALKQLSYTIAKIKEVSPKSRIVIIGPFPEWQESLIKQIINSYQTNRSLLPLYMKNGLNIEPQIWDEYFKINIPGLGVEYISALDYLCNKNGCLTRTSDDVEDITAVDFGHLTTSGSIYLIGKIESKIFLH